MIKEFVDSLYAGGGMPVIVTAIVAIALGALESFLGYRIFKVQAAVVGFLAGLAIGIGAFDAAFGIRWLAIVLGVVLGVLLGWLSFKIYKAGVFLLAGAFAFVVATNFVPNFWFGLVIGILVGLVGMFLTRHVLIISTALGGGSIAAGGVALLAWGSHEGGPAWVRLVIMLALGIAGAVVQNRTTPKSE